MIMLTFIQVAAGLYILWRCVLLLNHMTRDTRWAVRLATALLAAGACATVASCFMARDVFDCLFTVGVAAYFACNQRRGTL